MTHLIRRLLGFAAGAAFLALSSCAPGTDGIIITSAEAPAEAKMLGLGEDDIRVTLPRIPVVRLPDLSNVGDFDQLLQERLGTLALRPLDGVEVLTAECQNGSVIYSGDKSSDLFADTELARNRDFSFEVDPTDGSSSFFRRDFGVRTSLQTNGDGSGQFVEEGSYEKLSIDASSDGSGRYYSSALDVVTTVEVDATGAGVFYRHSEDGLMTVTVGTDGSGALYSERGNELITVDAKRDGSGDLYFEQGGRVVTLRVRPDRSWEYSDSTFTHEISISANADGSGQYRERGRGTVTLDFAADGTTSGPRVILPPTPQFAVADRFPALGTLASINPPCATILRFDTALLFAVNEHDLKPAAAALLAEVAPALIAADRAIEIDGHTDATGTADYNLALSQRRAESVAAELASLGVDVDMTINGYGESRPVASNYREDGSDDEAGQRQNRRVEIVIAG